MRPPSRASAAGVAALVLLLAPSCAPLWMHRPHVDTGTDLTVLRTGEIVVWISARPERHSGVIAASFARDFPGANLVQREIPREEFVARINSRRSDEAAPDVAYIDNYRQLEPLLEGEVVLRAWGRSRFRTAGWWVIFRNTKHPEKARAFVRWLNRAPGWQPRARNRALSGPAAQLVRDASMAAFKAITSGEHRRLESLLDRDAARVRPMAAGTRSGFSVVEPIYTFGNERIAFALLSAVGAGDSFYGMRQMIFIFRNQSDGWRLLHMDPDALVPIDDAQREIRLPPLLDSFDRFISSERAEPPPPSARLLEPADRAVLQRWPERPELAWLSEAATDSAFIIESQYADPGDEVNWSVSHLAFAESLPSTQPFRQRAPFGVGMQPHRWRIWTLVASGAVSVSSWRTIMFSN